MNGARSGSGPPDGEGSSSPPRDPRLWKRPVPMGYGIGFTAFATIAAPLLAGFSLATIVTLSSSADHRGTRGDIAIAAFCTAVVRMPIYPLVGLVVSDVAILLIRGLRSTLKHDICSDGCNNYALISGATRTVAKRLIARCRWTYNLGIIAFLGGIHRPIHSSWPVG